MSFSLAVVVPVLAGYWVLTRTHHFKQTAATTPAYAYPFFCAILGWMLVATAWVVDLAIARWVPPVALEFWEEHEPFLRNRGLSWSRSVW